MLRQGNMHKEIHKERHGESYKLTHTEGEEEMLCAERTWIIVQGAIKSTFTSFTFVRSSGLIQ